MIKVSTTSLLNKNFVRSYPKHLLLNTFLVLPPFIVPVDSGSIFHNQNNFRENYRYQKTAKTTKPEHVFLTRGICLKNPWQY